jgi:hypothetical protein
MLDVAGRMGTAAVEKAVAAGHKPEDRMSSRCC